MEDRNKYDSMNATDTARAFHVTPKSVWEWARTKGCPKNKDNTFSIYAVHTWLMKQLQVKCEGGDLERRKIEKDIELKNAKIEKLRGGFIEKSLHELILTSRAGSLRRFLTKTFLAHSIHLVGKTIEEVRTELYNLAVEAMNAYIGEKRESRKNKT
jgi:hypothetical protein